MARTTTAFLTLLIASTLLAETPQDTENPETTEPPEIRQAARSRAEVEGLRIVPGDMRVPSTQRAVTLTAECEKDVQWIVISRTNVQYMEIHATKQLVIFPNTESETIQVFAVSAKDGQPTKPAAVIIRVDHKEAQPATLPLGDRTVQDMTTDASTQDVPSALRASHPYTVLIIVNNETVSVPVDTATSQLKDAGHKVVYKNADNTDDNALLARLKYVPFIQAAGGTPTLIIMSKKGTVLHAARLPAEQADIVETVNLLQQSDLGKTP